MSMTKEEFLQAVQKLADILWKGDCKDLSDEELRKIAGCDKNPEFNLALHNLRQVPVMARIEKFRRFDVKQLETLSSEELLELLGTPDGDYMVEILVILRDRHSAQAVEQRQRFEKMTTEELVRLRDNVAEEDLPPEIPQIIAERLAARA